MKWWACGGGVTGCAGDAKLGEYECWRGFWIEGGGNLLEDARQARCQEEEEVGCGRGITRGNEKEEWDKWQGWMAVEARCGGGNGGG